jgi:hypothetical protein
VLLALSLFLASGLRGQEFSLEGSVVASGGGQSSGGDFALDGTIGQADAGDLSGGDFELSGGFWGIVATLDEADRPVLSLMVNAGDIVLWWPANTGTGFVLEAATALANPPATITWTPVNESSQTAGGITSVQMPLTPGNHFFRLRR